MTYSAWGALRLESADWQGFRGSGPMALRARSKLGKYRIQRRIAEGGFATVYRAYDTIEGIYVALKLPHRHLLRDEIFEVFRREIRISSRLQHANILPLKNADNIDGQLVLAYPVGEGTLADRLKRRISLPVALDLGEQMLEALAYAHQHRVIHCDVKPDNFILFEDNTVKLTDFGIAKIAARTLVSASGSGTVGYVAPEQAMGQPSFRSDCFSMGLILYRMLTGKLPRWPFDWPPPGHDALRRKGKGELSPFLKRAISVQERRRFANAQSMLRAFQQIRPQLLGEKRRRKSNTAPSAGRWREEREREFRRRFGKTLKTKHSCGRCRGPVAESMHFCPWCGQKRAKHRGESALPCRCNRCSRGMKLDWSFCAHCYGAAQGPRSDRLYTDRNYAADCDGCKGPLLPFSHYCPWCRRKVRRKWKIEGTKERCAGCGWSVLGDYWSACPWCGRRTGARKTR